MTNLPEKSDNPAALSALEKLKVVTLPEAAAVTSLSTDTLKREHSDKILQLSPRRLGMRLGDALAIGKPRD
jgi:hypothetical protein